MSSDFQEQWIPYEGGAVPRFEGDGGPKIWVRVGGVAALGAFLLLVFAPVLGQLTESSPQSGANSCRANLQDIGVALESYTRDSGRSPDGLASLVPEYLSVLPECPQSGRVSYGLETGPGAPYNANNDDNYYFVYCVGENHRGAHLPPNHPQLNSTVGLLDR